MPDAFSFDPLLLKIYPPKPPQQARAVPMQVLAVGISRSATESLRNALTSLGYTHCSHGWDLLQPPPFQMYNWWRLIRRKYHPLPSDPHNWRAADFDPLLGNCRAITDMPAALFSRELMEAYPEAKVILNVRKDLDAWYQSFDATVGQLSGNWVLWLAHWFSSELFWIVHVMNHGFLGSRFWRGGWRRNGKDIYSEHVQKIRDLDLPAEKLLEWSVEDGWAPLCKFLGKDVPVEEFPNGNAPAAFEQRIDSIMKRFLARAAVNCMLTLGAVGIVAAGLWYSLS